MAYNVMIFDFLIVALPVIVVLLSSVLYLRWRLRSDDSDFLKIIKFNEKNLTKQFGFWFLFSLMISISITVVVWMMWGRPFDLSPSGIVFFVEGTKSLFPMFAVFTALIVLVANIHGTIQKETEMSLRKKEWNHHLMTQALNAEMEEKKHLAKDIKDRLGIVAYIRKGEVFELKYDDEFALKVNLDPSKCESVVRLEEIFNKSMVFVSNLYEVRGSRVVIDLDGYRDAVGQLHFDMFKLGVVFHDSVKFKKAMCTSPQSESSGIDGGTVDALKFFLSLYMGLIGIYHGAYGFKLTAHLNFLYLLTVAVDNHDDSKPLESVRIGFNMFEGEYFNVPWTLKLRNTIDSASTS